jgi:urease accessory protein
MTMHCASIYRFAGRWPRERAAGGLTLDFDGCHRRRIRLTTDQGKDVLLDLPKAGATADGDGLQLEDGRWLRVHAAAELIAEVRHKDPNQLDRSNGASITQGALLILPERSDREASSA